MHQRENGSRERSKWRRTRRDDDVKMPGGEERHSQREPGIRDVMGETLEQFPWTMWNVVPDPPNAHAGSSLPRSQTPSVTWVHLPFRVVRISSHNQALV